MNDLDGDGLRELTPVARQRYTGLRFADDFVVTTTARAWRSGEHASLFAEFNDLGPTGLGEAVPDCAADLNIDGVLDLTNMNLFVQAFVGGEAPADSSTATPSWISRTSTPSCRRS